MAEEGIKSRQAGEEPCTAKSPGGWHCCRAHGHDGDHVASTADWGSLYYWPEEADRG